MAQTAITLTQLQNASADAQTLEVVINGDENTDVTTRLGNTYPTLDKALKLIMQHGLVGSTPYKTYQDLVNAHIPNNTYAVVTNDSDPSKNGLYLNDNGTLKYSDLNSVPQLMAELNKLIDFDGDYYDAYGRKVAWGITDDSDKLGAYIAADGTINAENIKSDDNTEVAFAVLDGNDKTALSVDNNGNTTIGNAQITNNGVYPFAIVDYNSQLLLAIDNNGDIVNLGLTKIKNALKNLTDLFNKSSATISLQKTDYMHVFSYGQSLSRGTMCVNPINTTQPYQNVMFGGSTTSTTPSGQLDRNYENADYTKFLPLIAQDNGKGEAESPVCGTVNGFVELQIKKGDVANQWKMVGTAPGEGGRSVGYLSKNSGGRYEDLLKQVNAGKSIANSLGQSYSVWAITWTQAEQDYAERTSRQNFKDTLIKLHDDLKKDIPLITGQTFTPPLICYQVASHRYYKLLRNDLALALLDASLERNDIMIACPMYQFEYSQDSLHLIAETSQQLGKYYARALDYVKTTGKKWQPLQVKNIIVQGRIIDIEFNKSGLVLDTSLVTKTHNYGFDIWQGDVLQNIIASVTVIDKNRVRIVLNASLPSNAYLTYARGRNGDPYKSGKTEGARGNLRDSNGDTDNYTDRQGVKYMHNWCVAFETKLN